MLRLSGLCKRFEDLPVLSNLSLTLSRGEIVALIGPSGCGKTTLLNIISGLTAPDAGTVEGADGRLSYMFQSARLLPWRTVEENIRLVREDAPAEEVRSLITAVGLEGKMMMMCSSSNHSLFFLLATKIKFIFNISK